MWLQNENILKNGSITSSSTGGSDIWPLPGSSSFDHNQWDVTRKHMAIWLHTQITIFRYRMNSPIDDRLNIHDKLHIWNIGKQTILQRVQECSKLFNITTNCGISLIWKEKWGEKWLHEYKTTITEQYCGCSCLNSILNLPMWSDKTEREFYLIYILTVHW